MSKLRSIKPQLPVLKPGQHNPQGDARGFPLLAEIEGEL